MKLSIKSIKKKTILKVLFGLIVISIPLLINIAFFRPTKLNAFIAAKVYKAPANSAFTDDNFYKCVVNAYNKKNGTSVAYTESLTDEQLKTITNLSCTFKKVHSTLGLEKLINLIELNIYGNEITNALGLEKLKKLTTLDVSINELETLDVSGNLALINLDVSDNDLIALDVSSNTALINLDASQNQLSKLDISKNISLTRLRLSDNKLTTLDMSKNPELTSLDATNNKLTRVDISNNLKLVALYLKANNLSRLEIKNNINLRFLSAEINKLVELDVSNNTALEEIDISNNYLTDFDLPNHAALKELNISSNNLTRLNISQSDKISSLEVEDNNLQTLILNKDFNTELFNKIGTQQKKVISVVIGEKVIAPSNNANLYINNKVVVLSNMEIENITKELGLENLTAKIYNGTEEVTVGIIEEGYVLKIYDGELEIQNLIITVYDNLMNFEDSNFYRCVVDNYNKENNTNVPYTEILTQEQLNNISELSCKQKNIVSTSGLEKLTNLKRLFIADNKLTDIDVSKNIALTDLSVRNNRLTALDVSKNTALTYLNAYYNQLTELDVTNNIALTDLDVYSNQLTELDVTNNIALTDLDVSSNQLTTLDVSKNTALKDLRISSNSLTELDVSKNTALRDLFVEYNQLTELDVSKNTALQGYLSVNNNRLTALDVRENTALTHLDVDNNQLTILDVSKNTALKYLRISSNSLTELDVSKNTALKHLRISNNSLTELDVTNNIALTDLNVSSNQLTTLDVSKNKALISLDVDNNQLTTLDVSKNTALRDLFVYNNQLTELDVSSNKSLTKLYVYGNPYKNDIIAYKGIETKINKDFIKLPAGKTSTLISISNDNLIINTKEKTIKSDVVGTFSAEVVYEHNISNYINTYSVAYNVKVINITSDKYKINDNESYIYIGNETDKNIILSNLNIPTEVECKIDLENNKLQVIWEENILKEFKLISVSSEIYDLSKDYVFEYNDNCISVINGTVSKNIENNTIEIKYNDIVVDSYKLVEFNSEFYDLSGSTIKVVDNTIEEFLEKINCINCDAKIYDGVEYLTEGEFTDNNTLSILYEEDVLKEYDLTFSVTGVTLNQEKIKLGLDNKNTFQLGAVVSHENAENKNVSWKSSDEDVAIVDENGLVTSKGIGKATITVTTEDGGYTDTVEVEVVQMVLYQITYKDGENTYNEYHEEGESIKLKTLEKEGYTLIGWLEGDKEYKLTDEIVMGSEDITLTSKWEANKYEVTYESNGGTIDKEKLEVTFDNEYGTLDTPIKKGHTFKGWYLEDSFETLVTDETIVKTASNHKLYAKWEINSYKLEIDAAGGTYEGETTLTLDYNSTKEITVPTRKGYTFKGWNIIGTESAIENKIFIMGISDTKLTAEWELIIPEISNHKVKDNLITNLLEGIKVNELDLELDEIYTTRVYDKNGTEKTEGNIGTGYKVKIYLDNLLVSEYTLVVSGDVTGDGIVNIADVLKIADHTINKNILTDYEELASEVTNDTNLNIADVLKIADYTLDKRIEIWR